MHDSSGMRISHLWRYPVKSLAGERLAEAELTIRGVPSDRKFQFVAERDGRRKALTARQIPQLLSYRAWASDGNVRVQGPDGSIVAAGLELAAKLQARFGRPMIIEEVQETASPFFDDSELLVINAASVRALAQERGQPVDQRRFRPTIVLDGEDAQPFAENGWVGRNFQAGTALISIHKRDVRCVITTIDPVTGAQDPSFLQLLIDRHEQCFGVYARVQTPGRIALGDEWRPQQ